MEINDIKEINKQINDTYEKLDEVKKELDSTVDNELTHINDILHTIDPDLKSGLWTDWGKRIEILYKKSVLLYIDFFPSYDDEYELDRIILQEHEFKNDNAGQLKEEISKYNIILVQLTDEVLDKITKSFNDDQKKIASLTNKKKDINVTLNNLIIKKQRMMDDLDSLL